VSYYLLPSWNLYRLLFRVVLAKRSDASTTGIFFVLDFWDWLFLAVFLDPILDISPVLWLVSHPMTFLAFFCTQLSSRFLHSGLALKPYIIGVPDSLCPSWANFCRRRDPPGGVFWSVFDQFSDTYTGVAWPPEVFQFLVYMTPVRVEASPGAPYMQTSILEPSGTFFATRR
jgi:hypothetical protein